MKKIVITSILLSSITACAVQEKPIVIKEVIPKKEVQSYVGHKVNECQSTQRDLSIPWRLRQYWCSDKNKVNELQKINNHLFEKTMTDDEYIEAINDEAINTPIAQKAPQKPIKNKVVSQKKTIYIKPVVLQKTVLSVHALVPSKTNKKSIPVIIKSSNKIIFAKNLRVLGPQGRQSTIALIPKIIGVSKVNIRGLILPDEVLVDSNVYKEQLSVARALAVRQLWVKNGVDIKTIKILHHSDHITGRAVEVYFNG